MTVMFLILLVEAQLCCVFYIIYRLIVFYSHNIHLLHRDHIVYKFFP